MREYLALMSWFERGEHLIDRNGCLFADYSGFEQFMVRA